MWWRSPSNDKPNSCSVSYLAHQSHNHSLSGCHSDPAGDSYPSSSHVNSGHRFHRGTPTNSHTDSRANSHAGGLLLSFPGPHGHADTVSHALTHAFADPYTNSHGNPHPIAHSIAYTKSHCYTYPSYPNAHSPTFPYAGSSWCRWPAQEPE